MKYIKDTINNEIIISRSRFLTSIYRVNNPQEADEILNDMRKKHISANHNCYAYIIGQNQEIQKCSDDGEPAKTAGHPMIEVLKKNELTNVLAITTRYFGGIMLGSGGLIRAYSQSVSETLSKGKFYNKKLLEVYEIVIDYTYYNTIINSDFNILIMDSTFADNITLKIGISKDSTQTILKLIDDLTNALARYKYLYEDQIEVPCE